MTEKQIEKIILAWLNSKHEIFAFKINTVGIYDQAKGIYRTNRNPFVLRGTADILGIAYGKPIAIEVKTPKTKNNVSHDQEFFLRRFNEKGGNAIVVSSLDEVIQFIERIKTT